MGRRAAAILIGYAVVMTLLVARYAGRELIDRPPAFWKSSVAPDIGLIRSGAQWLPASLDQLARVCALFEPGIIVVAGFMAAFFSYYGASIRRGRQPPVPTPTE